MSLHTGTHTPPCTSLLSAYLANGARVVVDE
jgi:hypothetical protein